MANLQSQIDILAKAVVKEHINIKDYKEKNKGTVSLEKVSNKVDVYDYKGVATGGGDKVNYEEESYKLKVNKDNEVSTTMFTYDNDHDFSGFWFYNDNDINSYAVNDRGEIVSSNSENFELGNNTFVRRIDLNGGEIGKTQSVKNSERMIYIENKALVDGTLLYNKDTLIIEDSSDTNWRGNYYVEFDDAEDKKIQLIVNSDLSGFVYPRESKYSVSVITNRTENETGVNFDILYTDTDGNSSIVYIYRSKDIGVREFEDTDTLLAVHLTPYAITIYESAFAYCNRLKKIKISNGVLNIGNKAFCECVKLKEITFPESMSTIGESAFENCVELTEIKIPCDIKAIKTNTFYNCGKLIKVEFSDIENSIVETIGNDAFAYCSKLKEIMIPSSVKTIGDNAFEGCSELTQLEIPNSVTEIGKEAFSGCSKITQLEITNHTTVIRDDAFLGCNNLKTIIVTIPYNSNAVNEIIISSLNIDDSYDTFHVHGSGNDTITYVKKESTV